MNSKAIGIFDSGLGGLTAVREIKKILPEENIIYFGDTGRVPYGTRSNETIIKYAKQDINFLMSFDIKAILIACGTVSSVALEKIRGNYGIPIYGVVEGAAAAAVKSTKNKKVGVLGTGATIKSNAYMNAIKSIDSSVEVFNKACPLFVPLVENGYFNLDNKAAKIIAEDYLSELIKNKVDTIILGCTHYPLLAPIIEKIVGEDVTLIDSGKEAACLLKSKIEISGEKGGICNYYVSDTTEDFSKYAEMFLNENITDSVRHINIEDF